MPYPVAINHLGKKLYLAQPGEHFVLKPFGPNSHFCCIASVVEIDEVNQTITLEDQRFKITIDFDTWDNICPMYVKDPKTVKTYPFPPHVN